MTRDTGTGGKNSSVLNLHNSLKSKNENVLVSQNNWKSIVQRADMYAMFNNIWRNIKSKSVKVGWSYKYYTLTLHPKILLRIAYMFALLGRWKVFFLSGQIYEKCRKTSRVLPAPAPAAGTKMFPTNFSLHTRGDGSLFHISSHLKSHYPAQQPPRQHSGSLADILDISWWSVLVIQPSKKCQIRALNKYRINLVQW